MSLMLFALYLTILMSGGEAAGEQCKPSEKSANGKALKGHTFKEVAVKAIIECQNLCESNHRCRSYNYYIPGMVCEMNSETKETKPYDFVTDDQRFYMKREVLKCGTVFDFENGLSGWTVTGTVFDNQPTYGDNPTARGREPSNHKGDWWIGGSEDRPSPSQPAGKAQWDGPQGSMTSSSFVIVGNLFTFLIGGGCNKRYTRAELIVEGNVVLKETGNCTETMTEKSWNVSAYTGKQAQLRLIDNSSSVWGHINFDHFEAICP